MGTARRVVVASILGWLAPLLAALPVVHVAPTGSDATGDGSAANPFRTIGRALAFGDPGGTVRVLAGEYPAEFTIRSPVTVEPEGGGVVEIGPRATPGPLVTVSDAPGVVLRGLRFAGDAGRSGVRVLGASGRLLVVDCTFRDFDGHGIDLAGPANGDARVVGCRFLRVGGASVAVTGAPRLAVVACEFRSGRSGLRLRSAPSAVVEDCAFVDLAEPAVFAIACPDLRVERARVTRCAHLPSPAAWTPAVKMVGAIALAAGSDRARLREVLVEDCGGYVGPGRFLGAYDGIFGVGVTGSDDVVMEDCALHRNAYGGVAVLGASARFAVTRTSFVGNGALAGPGLDVALHAAVPAVDARGCFWGVAGGPAFDGAAPGNGIAGSGAVALAPIADRPFVSPPSSIALEATLPGGLRPRALVVEDLDGDGAGDLLSVEDLSGALVVRRGGSGGLGRPSATPVGGTLVDLAVGRFDADPFPDVAVVDEDGDRLVILFGDGAGGFARRAAIGTARRPLRLRAGDLDGVAGDDVLVACAGDPLRAGGVQVFRGDGAGGFVVSALGGAANPTDVEIVDVDGDRLVDAVAYDVDAASPGLRTWRNLGSGRFGPVTVATVDAAPIADAALAALDADGLGGPDLVVATFRLLPGPVVTRIEVFPTGGAPFAPSLIDEVAGPVDMAGGDVGERGGARLVVALPAAGQVRVYGPFLRPSAPCAVYAELPFRRVYPQSVAVGELTGDGSADIAVGDGASGSIEVWRGRLPARVEPFGSGCAGSAGVPRILWRSVPELGASTFAVAFDAAPPSAAGYLLISVQPAAVRLGGCVLLVQPDPFAMLAVADGAGFGSVPLGVPIDRALLRGELFAQWWILDPMGAAFGALSSTAALRIHVGG